MKSIIFYFTVFFGLGCVFISCNTQPEPPVQSGRHFLNNYIIEYRTTVDDAHLKSVSTMTQWVDNVNKRYAVQTETTTSISGLEQSGSSLMIMKDGWNYVINLKEKTGFRTKADSNHVLTSSYLKPIEDDAFKSYVKRENGTILANENYFGKDCQVVELPEMGEGGEKLMTRYWYYKGIPLKMENSQMTMEAIRFEEDLVIPSVAFTYSDSITIHYLPIN